MRRSIVATALAAGVSVAACGSASAQSAGVEVYVGPPAAYDAYYDYPAYREYRYAPRAYGYYGERRVPKAEDYRTGSNRWWRQMEREGRSGQGSQ